MNFIDLFFLFKKISTQRRTKRSTEAFLLGEGKVFSVTPSSCQEFRETMRGIAAL